MLTLRLAADKRYSIEILVSASLLITLSAAIIGFVASVCFCIGAFFTKPQNIKNMSAGMVWGTNEALSLSIASQSAQYKTGGLFLVVSFILQIVATLMSSTNQPAQNLISLNPLLIVLLVLSLSAGAAYLIYCCTKKRLVKALELLLEEKQ